MASGYHAGQSRHQTRSPSRKLRLDNAVLTFESRQEAAAKSPQCPLGLHVPPPLPASPLVERNPARWDGHPHLQPDCPASTTHTPTTAGCLRGRQAWGQVLRLCLARRIGVAGQRPADTHRAAVLALLSRWFLVFRGAGCVRRGRLRAGGTPLG